MNEPIFVSGGSKGGVGKSIVTIALIDTVLHFKKKVVLIESDTSNPDVWKMYKDEIKTELIDLDVANGWIDMVNVCDENKDAIIIINTAARNNKGVTAYGGTLNSTLEELERKLLTFWVINRQRDSLELLKDYMDALPDSIVHVVRNSYFGDEGKFELYNGSKVRESVESSGGKSITFPDLADRVSDDLYSKRLSIDSAMKQLPIGNRAELTRWRNEFRKILGEVIDG
ncbi:protein mobD [Pseudomonas sp. AB12(2023)]|uniref:nucleotide-binding protein n=1 Tax=Pseudomonas sp. AB12(2023) TaxID=3048597 RepID=UPI002B23752F|nr:protein mobD [Pseudomonas sp. AB12(2023)]MEB0222066.1 protein mobD [Pseudomonas sp. AB12(2023)]